MNPIDRELARFRANADQLRSGTRDVLRGVPPGEVAELIRTCARGELGELDECVRQLVGNLALVAIMDLLGVARSGEED